MSDAPTAAELLEASREVASVSGDPAAALSALQLSFSAHFVANGGKSEHAAEAAGYQNASIMAARQLANPKVLTHIKRLVMASADAALPVAIRTLLACCNDEKASWKDRRMAALDLVKLAGAMPKDGPSVAVQVNVGSDQPASAVLRSVWDNRDARLSSIAAPMQDSEPRTIEHRADGDPAPTPAAGRGGVAIKGPVAPGS